MIGICLTLVLGVFTLFLPYLSRMSFGPILRWMFGIPILVLSTLGLIFTAISKKEFSPPTINPTTKFRLFLLLPTLLPIIPMAAKIPSVLGDLWFFWHHKDVRHRADQALSLKLFSRKASWIYILISLTALVALCLLNLKFKPSSDGWKSKRFYFPALLGASIIGVSIILTVVPIPRGWYSSSVWLWQPVWLYRSPIWPGTDVFIHMNQLLAFVLSFFTLPISMELQAASSREERVVGLLFYVAGLFCAIFLIPYLTKVIFYYHGW